MEKIIIPEVMTPEAIAAQGDVIECVSHDVMVMRAENCIKNHVIAAMGMGLIPSAMVDVIGITAIEVRMIRNLARIYNFPIPTKLITYKVLISLIGSIGPVYLSTKMHTALKGVPLIGHAVFVGLLSATGGAAVYAVGKIFEMHFESGGRFLSKDNKYIRKYFKEKYAEGKKAVKEYAKYSKTAATEATA